MWGRTTGCSVSHWFKRNCQTSRHPSARASSSDLQPLTCTLRPAPTIRDSIDTNFSESGRRSQRASLANDRQDGQEVQHQFKGTFSVVDRFELSAVCWWSESFGGGQVVLVSYLQSATSIKMPRAEPICLHDLHHLLHSFILSRDFSMP